jgi:alkanesulfonate monooxygenase SsuD/methylene tetrahydromethanopterin reductase-like flavin-dependent oxidoreductase (luciferase family)
VVKFGFGSLTCQVGPGERRSSGELYRESIVLAQEAERLGFDSVWLSEHHFFSDGYTPSPLVLAAALAARTERIAIGTGVLLAPLHNPVRLAEDAATVQLLSQGRLVLGIAQGWKRDEFEGLGLPYERRHVRFEEAVRVVRAAWGDGPVTPKPTPQPPLWVGGMSEPAVRRAARVGECYLASWASVDEFRRRIEWARDENPGIELAIVAPTFAWIGDYRPLIREPLAYYVSCFRRDGTMPDHLVAGSPEQVAEQINAYREAAGGELSYTAEFVWPGLDRGVLAEAMALFSETVTRLVR